MKKKAVANLIMVAIIVFIAIAGVLGVGYIRGWFDKEDDSVAILADIRGVVHLYRDGVMYPVENDTVLRSGDTITSGSGTAAVIRLGGDYITIGGKAEIDIADPTVGGFSAAIDSGEVFVHSTKQIGLCFADEEIMITDATAAVSVRSGAQTVYVFRGNVEDVAAGQYIEYIGGEKAVNQMQLGSLNDFILNQIRKANESQTLCYSNGDLDELAAKRQQALQDLINGAPATEPSEPEETTPLETAPTQPIETTPTQPVETDPEETEPAATEPVETEPPATEPSHNQQTQATEPTETVPPQTEPAETEPPQTEPMTTEPTQTVPTEPAVTEPAPTETLPPPTTEPVQTTPTETEPPQTEPPATEEPAGICYITIRCDTILDNMDKLEPGKAEFIPEDGIILPVVEVEFYAGETVFDVLRRVCRIADIQLEYSWTPLYDSYYVEGINNLYEFDCGFESGWMYKVNEWFPNYGCSSYELQDGDVIVWCYTCVGLGADVGDDTAW